MNKKFTVPRGTSDILPDEVLLWEELESKARKVCKSYGYREIRTPIFEDTGLFKRSLGQTSDIVNKQLLYVTSQMPESLGKLSDRSYANMFMYENVLRPEGTAAVVRSYLENSFDKKELLSKFFYIGPMFRGERPQKGRQRQFHQIGVEAIGPNSNLPYIDAEVIALAMHLLKEFGVKNPKLKINSLGSKEDKEQISKWLKHELSKYKDDLCNDCKNRYERNAFRVLDCKNELCRKVIQKIFGKEDGIFMESDDMLPLSPESRKYFKKVYDALQILNIQPEVSRNLVRGLDYYTHTVFEITAEGLGSQDAVGAGGRYGGLVHELGGRENVEGIGFALGIERILLASGGVWETKVLSSVKPGLDVFVIAMKEEYQPQAFLLLQQLREAGISVDTSFTGGSMGSQMGKADKAFAYFTLILGEDEMKNNMVAVKDMQAGTQEYFEVKNIVEEIKKKFKPQTVIGKPLEG